MNKKYIIRKNEEIQEVIKSNKKVVNKNFVLFYCNNNLKYNRYCISVSKKIGKAHVRNLYKRRVKDVLLKNSINSSKDYVIILRNSILNLNYQQINDSLIDLINRVEE